MVAVRLPDNALHGLDSLVLVPFPGLDDLLVPSSDHVVVHAHAVPGPDKQTGLLLVAVAEGVEMKTPENS
jgi:hypothetical protein